MTKSDLMLCIYLLGVFMLGLICVMQTAIGMEQMQLQLPEDKSWWSLPWSYRFEIFVVLSSCLAGYIAGQHYKNSREDKIDAFGVASFSGLITGVLATWILTNKYSFNESLQGGILLAFCCPAIIFGLFLILDKFFPGKVDFLKKGILPQTNAGKLAAAIVGKRKEIKYNRRSSDDKESDDITPVSK